MKKKLVLCTLAVSLVFWAAPAFSQTSPLSVYVSILPQKYFIERIGGEKVSVSVMVGPGKSPATYEPSPKQMGNLANARLYFSIGVPFEKIWMNRLLANHPHLRVIDTLDGIQLIPMADHSHESEGPDEENKDKNDHEQEHGKAEGILDPHVWTSPPRVKIMADHILRALIKEMPSQKQEFMANYQNFVRELDLLTADINRKLEPIQKREFLVFHPSWGYFAETFNLDQIAIETEGKEPGARTLAGLIQLAKERNIRVIFVQKQFSSAAARMIAEAIDGRVEAIDPLAEDYIENLRRVAEILVEAMKQ
jgi:zinc transport system substrate-binding protein